MSAPLGVLPSQPQALSDPATAIEHVAEAPKTRRPKRQRISTRPPLDAPPHTLMTEEDFCGYLGIGRGTARNWRLRGEGPPHRRVTARMIRYQKGEVDAWLSARKVQSSSEIIRDA